MYSEKEGKLQFYLIDFGAADFVSEKKSELIVLTRFTSKEQMEGRSSFESDVYSFAKTMLAVAKMNKIEVSGELEKLLLEMSSENCLERPSVTVCIERLLSFSLGKRFHTEIEIFPFLSFGRAFKQPPPTNNLEEIRRTIRNQYSQRPRGKVQKIKPLKKSTKDSQSNTSSIPTASNFSASLDSTMSTNDPSLNSRSQNSPLILLEDSRILFDGNK